MGYIRDRIQQSLDDSGEQYILKSDGEIINTIAEFGLGDLEFNTADIERLIMEKQALWCFLQKIGTDPNSIV